MSVKSEFQYLSADGKSQIHAIRWEPEDGKITHVLQITHGMTEYVDRYDEFANFLTEHGFLVVGHDHLGHGWTAQTEEELGYFAKKHPSDTLVEDMHTLRIRTQGENPGIPYFMMGHSMGSYMLRKYLGLHGKDLDGAIIMGTGFVPKTMTAFAKCFTRFVALFRGWHHRSLLVAMLSFGKPYRRYDLTGQDLTNSWLTKDTEILTKYKDDPKGGFLFTLNGFYGLFEAVSASCDKSWARRVPKELPMLLVSGADDPVGNFGDGVEKSRKLYEQAGIEDLTMKLYDNDRHPQPCS